MEVKGDVHKLYSHWGNKDFSSPIFQVKSSIRDPAHFPVAFDLFDSALAIETSTQFILPATCSFVVLSSHWKIGQDLPSRCGVEKSVKSGQAKGKLFLFSSCIN